MRQPPTTGIHEFDTWEVQVRTTRSDEFECLCSYLSVEKALNRAQQLAADYPATRLVQANTQVQRTVLWRSEDAH